MHLDIDTLLFASISSRCAYLLVFVVAGFRQRRDGSILHWAASITLSMLGVAVTAKSDSYPYFPIWSGTLSYAVYGTSVALCWSGLRRFNARPLGWPIVAIQGLAPGVLYGAILATGHSGPWALAGVFAALAAVMARTVGEALARDGHSRLWSRYVVVAPLVAYLLTFVTSIILLAVDRARLSDPSNAYLSLLIDQFCSVLVYTGLLAMSGERDNARLQHRATVDPLTSLQNRYGLQMMTEAPRTSARRAVTLTSVVLVDLDHFKRINDSYGHGRGDAVLVEFARRFRAVFKRRHDVLVRWGGEEFLAVLQGTELDLARSLAEQLRVVIEADVFRLDGIQVPVTVSVGVAEMSEDGQGLEEAIRRADVALYAAKAGGRNRICS